MSVFFLMIRRPPRSTLDRSSAASDVYKRQGQSWDQVEELKDEADRAAAEEGALAVVEGAKFLLSLLHISEPPRPY